MLKLLSLSSRTVSLFTLAAGLFLSQACIQHPNNSDTKSIPQVFPSNPVITSSSTNASNSAVIGAVPIQNNPNLALGIPINRTQKPEILISRPEYVISWNRTTRTPNWVAWTVEPNNLGAIKRSNSFAADPDLEGYLQKSGAHAVTEVEYSGSCFDRGHQSPSGDRTATTNENMATFLMSNMIPQTAFLNRVIWEHLEEHERSLVQNPNGGGTKIQIIAGTLFPPNPAAIGPNHDILVPNFNYKIIVPLSQGAQPNRNDPQLIVVKMPNVTSKNTDPIADHNQECTDFGDHNSVTDGASPNDWMQYKTTLDEVEQLSGFTFFSH